MHDTELEATYDASRFRLEANYGSILGCQRGTPYDLPAPMPDIFTGIASLKMPEVDGLLNARIQVAGSCPATTCWMVRCAVSGSIWASTMSAM